MAGRAAGLSEGELRYRRRLSGGAPAPVDARPAGGHLSGLAGCPGAGDGTEGAGGVPAGQGPPPLLPGAGIRHRPRGGRLPQDESGRPQGRADGGHGAAAQSAGAGLTAFRKTSEIRRSACQPLLWAVSLPQTTEQSDLRGRVKFPIGGKVRARLTDQTHDLVKFQNQQLQSG